MSQAAARGHDGFCATWSMIMNKRPCFYVTALALSLILPEAAFAQNAPTKKALVVNGRTANAAVVQIDGHSYVDVDTFARMINAAVKFEPERIILTVPATEAGAKVERTAPGLSKDFSKAGISQLAEMREWKAAIASVIRSGVAEGNWLVPLLHDHRVRAEAPGLEHRHGRTHARQPSDITTGGDHAALAAADDDRLVAQFRPIALLHRGVEGVAIEMGDG